MSETKVWNVVLDAISNTDRALVAVYFIPSDGFELQLPVSDRSNTLVNWGDAKNWDMYHSSAKHVYQLSGTYTVKVVGGLPIDSNGCTGYGTASLECGPLVIEGGLGQVITCGTVPLRLPISCPQTNNKRVKMSVDQYALLVPLAQAQMTLCESCFQWFPYVDIGYHNAGINNDCDARTPSDIFSVVQLGLEFLTVDGVKFSHRQITLGGLHFTEVNSAGITGLDASKGENNTCFYLSCSVRSDDKLAEYDRKNENLLTIPRPRMIDAAQLKRDLKGASAHYEFKYGCAAGEHVCKEYVRKTGNTLCVIARNSESNNFETVRVYNPDRRTSQGVTVLLLERHGDIGHYTRLMPGRWFTSSDRKGYVEDTKSAAILKSPDAVLQFLKQEVRSRGNRLVRATFMTRDEIAELISLTNDRAGSSGLHFSGLAGNRFV